MSSLGSAPTGVDKVSSAVPADDDYRLAFIRPVRAPSGNSGTDWFMYSIARGSDVITGYRRGGLELVKPEVERVIALLNERRLIKRR